MELSLRRVLVSFVLILSLATLTQCKKKNPDQPDIKPTGAELNVLTYGPVGEEMPISTEGITVMFDQPMIPLTTLDSQKEYPIDMTIEPAIEGSYHWLGTKGFIFRPKDAWIPATTYKVKLKEGMLSINGAAIKKPIEWSFSTVRPKVMTTYSNSMLLPKSAVVSLNFNVSMNKAEIEKKLQIVKKGSEVALNVGKKFRWLDDDHRATITLDKNLPWGETIVVKLPADLKGRVGSLGSKEEYSAEYSIYDDTFWVDSVETNNQVQLKPDAEEAVQASEEICYLFSQPITADSFQKAFQITDSQGKPEKVNVYNRYSEYFEIEDRGAMRSVIGYDRGCFSLPGKFAQKYKMSLKTEALEAVSGAKFEGKSEQYAVSTPDAEPMLSVNMAKTILSEKNPAALPMEAMNLSEVLFRIYPISNEYYSEFTKGQAIQPEGRWDQKTTTFVYAEPPVSTPVGNYLVLPMDNEHFAIDQSKMPATWTYKKTVENKTNISSYFKLDLTNDIPGIDLKPGVYLIESIGSSKDGQITPLLTIFQVSPIALAIKREVDHVMVWATDIESGEPAADVPVKITLKDRNDPSQDKVIQQVTNKEGVILAANDSTSTDSWSLDVCAEVTDVARNSLSCQSDHLIGDDYRSTLHKDPYHFAYVYTDRPIYRPGQTVYFSSFIRRVKEGRYFMPAKDEKATVYITDSSGSSIYDKADIPLSESGVVSGSVDLSADDDIPRGNYTVEITVGEQIFTKKFAVASYKKPSFKVDLAAEKDSIASHEDMRVNLTGSYFFGAPMRKAKAKWSIMTSTYIFSPENYESFQFIDDDVLYSQESDGEIYYSTNYEYDMVDSNTDEEDSTYVGEDNDRYRPRKPFFKDTEGKEQKRQPASLDDKGQLTISYKPDLTKYPVSQTLTVEANVSDPTQQEVSTVTDVVVHKGQYYFGVKPDRYVYAEKSDATIDLVSLDKDGQVSPKQNYKVSIYKRDYDYVERQSSRGYWETVYQKKDTLMQEFSGKTDAQGAGQIKYKVPSEGTFRVVIDGQDSVGNKIHSANTFYAWSDADDYVPWKIDGPTKLELVTDKATYQVGDTAKVLVKSLMPLTKALVTYERGRVLDYKIIELGGNAGHIEIPITEGMLPNMYVSVVAPAARDGKRAPMLFYGEAQLSINPEAKRLNVSLQTDKPGSLDKPGIYRPGDEVTVKIKTTNPDGKAQKGHVIVSVADESVLKLLNYQLPDLVEKFFFPRNNSVLTSSSLISLKAGDGGGKSDARKRRIFKDTADFQAHLVTDEKGEASFKFKLPDDLTTWVVEAVAISDSVSYDQYESVLKKKNSSLQSDLSFSDNTFVGSERTKLISTLPILVRPGLPRFAAWGDTFNAKVVLNNQNDQPVEGKLEVVIGDSGTIVDNNSTKTELPFKVEGKSESAFSIPIRAKRGDGVMSFEASAKNSSGTVLDAFETNLRLFDRYNPEVTATSGMTQSQMVEKLDLPATLEKTKGGLKYTLKSTLAMAVAESIRDLIYYPYGCAEQRSSSLAALLLAKDFVDRFGLIYLDQVMPWIPLKKGEKKPTDAERYEKMEASIKQTIEELPEFVNENDGGVKYWKDSQLSDFFVSAQVLWVLGTAKDMGYVVDESVVSGVGLYLRNFISANPTWDSSSKAFAVWSMNVAHQTPPPNLIDELVKKPEELSSDSISYLLMGGQDWMSPADRDKMIKRLEALALQEPRHTSWGYSDWYFSSPMKNTALATEALLKVKPDHPFIPRAMTFLFNRKRTSDMAMTQDNLAMGLLARDYSKMMNEDQTNYLATLKIGTEELAKQAFAKSNLLEVHSGEVPMEQLAKQNFPVDLTVGKTGTEADKNGTLYYDYELKYYLPPDQSPPREEGLIIQRNYYSLDDAKEEHPLTEFEAGENYKGVITLIVPQDMNYVLVEDPLPAGFEPIDMTLATSSLSAASETEGQEEYYDSENSFHGYDDEIYDPGYGMTYGFGHQEIHDDAIIWSDEYVPVGTYTLRYPIRAVTDGSYTMGGARAFEFYEPEILARSRGHSITIKPARP